MVEGISGERKEPEEGKADRNPVTPEGPRTFNAEQPVGDQNSADGAPGAEFPLARELAFEAFKEGHPVLGRVVEFIHPRTGTTRVDPATLPSSPVGRLAKLTERAHPDMSKKFGRQAGQPDLSGEKEVATHDSATSAPESPDNAAPAAKPSLRERAIRGLRDFRHAVAPTHPTSGKAVDRMLDKLENPPKNPEDSAG